MDLASHPRIDDYHTQLQKINLKVPVFSVDARQRDDVSIMVQALLYSLDPGLGG